MRPAFLLVLFAALATFCAAHAQSQECKKTEPKRLCGGTKQEPRLRGQALELQVATCGAELRNCVCDLIGKSNCSMAKVATGIILDRRNALEVGFVTEGATSPDQWNDAENFALSYNRPLAKRLTAISFAGNTNMRNLASIMRTLEICEGVRRSASSEQPVMPHEIPDLRQPMPPKFAVRGELEPDEIAQLSPPHQAEYFSYVAKLRDYYGRVDQWRVQWDEHWDGVVEGSGELAGYLTCAFRLGSDQKKHALLSSWPSECGCGDDGRGIRLDGVCLTTYAEPRFADLPIDEQIPSKMKAFIGGFKSKLPAGYKMREIGLNGCTSLRLRTTGQVKSLKEGDRLSPKHLSDHSSGSSCDVTFIEIERPDGSVFRFKTVDRDSEVRRFPFTEALQQYALGKRVPSHYDPDKRAWVEDKDWKKYRTAHKRDGDKFYREAEAKIVAGGQEKPRFGMNAEQWMQFKMGIFARNAFSEAGFPEVADPLDNIEHQDHFHLSVAEHND